MHSQPIGITTKLLHSFACDTCSISDLCIVELNAKQTAKINDDAEEYVRHDGTLTYFFTEAELRALVERQGFVVDKVSYIEKEVVNRAQGVEMGRRWLQLVARKQEREPDLRQG